MSEAKKDRSGKPDLSLIPYCVEAEVAKAMMNGEERYGRYNYCNGHKFSDLVGAAKRHLGKFMDGEDVAPDSGVHHLGHAIANCLMMLHQIELGTAKDNRYKPDAGKPSPRIEIGDAYVPMPVTVWQIMAKGRNGSELVVNTLITKPSKEDLAKAGRDWPTFTISVKEVTDDFGHKATA